jgi:hypothetical protein
MFRVLSETQTVLEVDTRLPGLVVGSSGLKVNSKIKVTLRAISRPFMRDERCASEITDDPPLIVGRPSFFVRVNETNTDELRRPPCSSV